MDTHYLAVYTRLVLPPGEKLQETKNASAFYAVHTLSKMFMKQHSSIRDTHNMLLSVQYFCKEASPICISTCISYIFGYCILFYSLLPRFHRQMLFVCYAGRQWLAENKHGIWEPYYITTSSLCVGGGSKQASKQTGCVSG